MFVDVRATRSRWVFLTLLAVAAWGLMLSPAALASVNPPGITIGVNFAAEEPPNVTSEVNGAAGVLGTAHWNNVTGINSDPSVENLIADNLGAQVGTSATVEWMSNNLWSSWGRGEENNNAPDGNDRNLMSGYLDTTADSHTRVTVSNLGFITTPYDVYVYIQGGVNGRFGNYTIEETGETQMNTVTAAFDGEYVRGEEGNYIVFEGVTGSSFTLDASSEGTPGFRAPINAIEIFAMTGLACDVNDDDACDVVDFDIILDNFLQSVTSRGEGDLTGDGLVALDDFRMWKDHPETVLPGGSSAIPEPAGLALALLAACGLIWQRRIRV